MLLSLTEVIFNNIDLRLIKIETLVVINVTKLW